jgi:protein-S-isoprenylcysteine O-methyltransferase Ste14
MTLRISIKEVTNLPYMQPTQEQALPTAAPSNWYRGFIQGKTRIVLAWLFAALLVFSAREFPHWPGILLCFFGATIRYWASGYLRKDSRPAVGGPYAWVRNPLYLGTYLMALGTALAIHAWVLLAVITLLFAAIYHYIILDEETKLQRIFGEPYNVYCTLVPRFFPRPWRARREALMAVNPEAAHHGYSRELAAKNKAFEAYASFLGLIGFVAAVAAGWKHFG